jgi:hypothetical protein
MNDYLLANFQIGQVFKYLAVNVVVTVQYRIAGLAQTGASLVPSNAPAVRNLPLKILLSIFGHRSELYRLNGSVDS